MRLYSWTRIAGFRPGLWPDRSPKTLGGRRQGRAIRLGQLRNNREHDLVFASGCRPAVRRYHSSGRVQALRRYRAGSPGHNPGRLEGYQGGGFRLIRRVVRVPGAWRLNRTLLYAIDQQFDRWAVTEGVHLDTP